MDVSGVPAPAVAAAARAGDQQALEELIADHLPLVYTIVGRALRRPSEVDDAVRATMPHVVGGDGDRSGVVATTIREIRLAHRRRMALAAGARPEDDPGADLVDLTIARPGLSDQQREIVQATRWLDPPDRELLALWWLEVCGELTRAEVAAGLGLSTQHTASRVGRMRARLQTARVVVRVIGDRAATRCTALDTVLVPWDRRPHAVWRKRIARHTRQCLACGTAWANLAGVERLVAGFALLTPPAALAAAVAADLRAALDGAALDGAALDGAALDGAVRDGSASAEGEAAGPTGSAEGAGAVATDASAAGTDVSTAGTGRPGVLTRSVQFLVSTPVIAGTMAAVLVAGGLLAYQLIVVPLRGDPASTAPAERTGVPAAAPSAAPSTGPVPGADPVFSNAVPRMPVVGATTELGPIRQHPRVDARDNGQSVRYEDRSVWIFADTRFRNPFGFLSNSGAVTTDLTAGDGITLTSTNPFTGDAAGDPVELIPRTEAELRFEAAHGASSKCTAAQDPYCGVRFGFWPGAVLADPARGRVLIFYHKLCRGRYDASPCTGLLGKPLGSGIAVLDMRTERVTRLTATGRQPVSSIEGPDPTAFFPPGSEFTAAALTVGETAYVYGACTYLGCKLARVGLAGIVDRSAWTFYTGRDRGGTDRWSPDPGRAVNTVAAGAAGHTVLWNPALRCFMNLLLPYGTNRAEFQVGGSPFGPWSRPRSLLDTAPGAKGANYAFFGHPEYAEHGGLVQYVSYYELETGHQRLVRVMFAPSG